MEEGVRRQRKGGLNNPKTVKWDNLSKLQMRDYKFRQPPFINALGLSAESPPNKDAWKCSLQCLEDLKKKPSNTRSHFYKILIETSWLAV